MRAPDKFNQFVLNVKLNFIFQLKQNGWLRSVAGDSKFTITSKKDNKNNLANRKIYKIRN